MTTKQQRIAIAEVCKVELRLVGDSPITSGEWKPDYPNDLNAMHEAEKLLLETDKWNTYEDYLCVVCSRINEFPQELTHATAAQRAEAFLRTIGMWAEDIA